MLGGLAFVDRTRSIREYSASANVEEVTRPLLFSFVFLLVLVPATAFAQPTGFDREAAANALARDYDACLPDDTPLHVVVTFLPSGEVDSDVDATWLSTPKTWKNPRRDPVPDGVKACIRRRLDGVRIGAFTGAPVRVGKKIELGVASAHGCAGLTVASSPWSSVFVDGKLVGPTPVITRLSDGDHEIILEHEDGTLVRRHHRFQCGRRLELSVNAKEAPSVREIPMPSRVTLEDARRREAR